MKKQLNGYGSNYKKPQMKTPRVTPLEGVYTYACGHTWVRSREPAGFRHDERRCIVATDYVKTTHRKGRKERKAMQQEPLRSGVTKIRYGINNELERTDTNSGHSEFVRVRISSLLISVLRLLCAPAHERAPPQPAPAVHLRLSRAGG
jgi:hypothetical protein